MSTSTTPVKAVSAKATALAGSVQAPTAAMIRGYFASKGQPVKSKVTPALVIDYLKGNPATTRALARKAGIQVGTRGRLHPDTLAAVADSLSL